MATATQHLLTAEEFGRRPAADRVEELVRGKIVMSPLPGARRGKICVTVGRLLGNFVAERDLGHVLGNDAGVVIQRGPDTVRGPDAAYYSYARLPKDSVPTGYPPQAPELVFEVRSPSDRWPGVLAKVAEYLDAGVLVVVVLDPEALEAHVYRGETSPTILGENDALRFPEILPGFQVVVGRLFG